MATAYDPTIVALSFAIAILASFTALRLASRVAASTSSAARDLWILGGSVAMGAGIWSMHFVGMLAMKMSIPLSYEPLATAFSGLIAIAASALALALISGKRLGPLRLIGGGTIFGVAILGMHYTGMSAIQVTPQLSYDFGLVALSGAIAIIASTVATWLFFVLSRPSDREHRLVAQIGASLLMGAAICGMHYTGMAAAHFADGSICTTADGIEKVSLVYGVILTTGLLLMAAIGSTILDAHLSEHRKLSTTLARRDEQFSRLAHHDHLTGLPNRSQLKDYLSAALAKAQRHGRGLAVLLLDLDGFKGVNDQWGAAAGDWVLQEISARLEQTVRNSAGFVSRLSGDEFVIVMEASIGPALDRICGSILEAVRQPIVFDSRTCEVTASLGGAVYPVHGADSRSLLIHADGAMYAAKKAGKNTALFSQKASIRATALVGELTRAIQNEEFELYYQPTIDALTGHIQGAEALVRWNHPVRGVLSPAEFIPAAEDLGLIHSLGDWILDQACMRLAEWHSRGLKYTMAVNLSAVQLQDEDFPGRAKAILDKHGIQPGQLVAEVTETFAITGMDACAKALQALRQLGVVIAMDDFGTGYSSLSHLHRLPVGELKIDRSFVNGLPRDKEAMRICEAIVALAHSLKIQVTAEGVETREQQTAVTEFGCDILQGYLFGRPMPWADFSARLERAALAVHPSTSQLAA